MSAKAFYEDQLEQMAGNAELPGSLRDGLRIARERPPDWSNALIVRHPDGHQVVAARLGGPLIRTSDGSIASMGTMVFELDGEGQVSKGRILEFVRFGTVPETGSAQTLTDYWRTTFEDSLVVVAEFNMRYESQRSRVFRAGNPPGEASLQIQRAGVSKTQADCMYWIMCYYDPYDGALLYCDGSSIVLMYCIGGDDDCPSGDYCGGGGGGGDDDDETDEEECACDDPIPCAMEAEYGERNPGFTITCDMFTTSGGSAHFSWAELNGYWAGGNESQHQPWGYISSSLPGHLEQARQTYRNLPGNASRGFPLSSGYRCPHGNASYDGDVASYHMQGRAADVPSGAGCDDVEEAFESTNASIDTCEEHADHIHGQW